jgi:multidrug efflux pump subunit AcrA (membrane-fusion protein)
MYINPVVDEVDRSVKVIAEVENRSGELKGGLFAKGRILTGAKRNVLQVPRSALIGVNITAKKAGLFVVTEDRARFREVTTGVISGEHVEIASGLDPGERVVVRGSFNLKDSDRVTIPGEPGK